MLPTTLALLAALTLTGPLDNKLPLPAMAHGQPSDDTIVRNMYDLRELRGDIQMVEQDALDDLLNTIFSQFVGANHSELTEGVYVVEGTQEQLDQTDELIGGLRSTVSRSFVIRIECWQVPAGSSVALGRPLPSDAIVTHWCEAIAGARRETDIQATTIHSYINKWSPVVSDSSVGYDPQPETIEAGLTLTVVVSPQDEPMVRARILGELTDVILDQQMVEMGGATLPFTSPTTTRRFLFADALIPINEPVVLQILPGLEPGGSLALTARVAPVDSVLPQGAARP